MGKNVKPPKIEFSKLIFWLVFAMTASVTVYAGALMWRTGDTTGLAYLIPACFGEFATATGFYYGKARKENEIKLMKAEGLKVGKEDILEDAPDETIEPPDNDITEG